VGVSPSAKGWKGVRVGVASRGTVTRNKVVGEAAGNKVAEFTPAAAQPVKKMMSTVNNNIRLMAFLIAGLINSIMASIVGRAIFRRLFYPPGINRLKTRNDSDIQSQVTGSVLRRQWWVPRCRWGLRLGCLLLSEEAAPLVYSSGLPWEYPWAELQASWSEYQLVKPAGEKSAMEGLEPTAARKLSARDAGLWNCPCNWPVEAGGL